VTTAIKAERFDGSSAPFSNVIAALYLIFAAVQDPSRLAFGGGSFAGVTALLAATTLPHVFGGILVESPSLWVGEGRFLGVSRSLAVAS
jgi:hypothetical protein